MGKVKSKRKLKLVPAYVLLAVLFLLGAMGIADFERGYIEKRQMLIASKYTDSVETFNDYKVWDEDGNVYVMSQSDSRAPGRRGLCRMPWQAGRVPSACSRLYRRSRR